MKRSAQSCVHVDSKHICESQCFQSEISKRQMMSFSDCNIILMSGMCHNVIGLLSGGRWPKRNSREGWTHWKKGRMTHLKCKVNVNWNSYIKLTVFSCKGEKGKSWK